MGIEKVQVVLEIKTTVLLGRKVPVHTKCIFRRHVSKNDPFNNAHLRKILVLWVKYGPAMFGRTC